jgi:hypothetical protein
MRCSARPPSPSSTEDGAVTALGAAAAHRAAAHVREACSLGRYQCMRPGACGCRWRAPGAVPNMRHEELRPWRSASPPPTATAPEDTRGEDTAQSGPLLYRLLSMRDQLG